MSFRSSSRSARNRQRKAASSSVANRAVVFWSAFSAPRVTLFRLPVTVWSVQAHSRSSETSITQS